ncbi:exosortase C-terminal domain/associated protein EpsI [Nitratidesulfovibrio sp. SRB-5]|uniref:exosortase C-terminal domain/associated protein EpsI n=1 Tax=Nitratidesulfovibrio sp. SRB-5 TaxID=2872636 RepID=UPI001CBA6727|nr:exosortase C-terminal domain/associated protein EpsI [Nitratidesulfovibrio sp. SRB-5]
MQMRIRVLVVLLFLAAGAYVSHARVESAVLPQRALSDFPLALGEWRSTGQVFFDSETMAVLRPTDYLVRLYTNDAGRRIGLYVGFHGGGKGAGAIHSPRNCLPGAGWLQVDSARMDVPTPAGAVQLVRATYAKEAEGAVYYYWYEVRGEPITDDMDLKLAELRNAVLHGRRDAAFIRLDVPVNQAQGADADVAAFIAQLYPTLRLFLPQ